MTTQAEIASAIAARRDAVVNLLEANPQGLTVADIATMLGIAVDAVNEDIRWLRRQPDVPNIPCQPNGHNQPWLYFLSNDVKLNRWWATNRVDDQVSRFRTEVGMAATLVGVTDGRSVEGRKARKIERTLTFLLGELAELDKEMALMTNGTPA